MIVAATELIRIHHGDVRVSGWIILILVIVAVGIAERLSK